MNAGARSMVVMVAVCSWIAISNHCAFAALATKPASAQNECPFHSKPGKQKEQQSSQVQCCKVLRAVVLAKTKSWTRDHANFSAVALYFEEWARVGHSRAALAALFLDTGPPGAHSFAELILQRSLFAHAPPSLG
jgi:hypothetical protein